ncbi:MAG: hypothetical protein J6Q10_02550 [Clostridia bacterium]|nr:hypothetical protein [Clostridia bacterium]
MLLLEIFEDKRELAMFLADPSRFEGKTTLITADNREILDKLVGKSKEWYRIEYRGKRENLSRYLSTLRIECINDYFLHISLPESGTIGDLKALVLEICETESRAKNVPALSCTNDPTLAEDEVEVCLVVPVFDFGWQISNMWTK